MKNIKINDKTLTIFEGGQDGKIGIKFNSQELDLDSFLYKNNGLEKIVKAGTVLLDIAQNKILTNKKTYSITPTGDQINTVQNPVFETAQADVDLFMNMIGGLLIPAIINGICVEMGIDTLYDVQTGQLKDNIEILEDETSA